ELQAAGQHRHRQFLWIRGRQQKLDVRRWLLQGLQQGVETGGGEHVDFVDQVNLEASAGRRILDVLQQLAHILHFSAGGRVNFNQVDKTPFGDYTTSAAGAAGLGRNTRFTVKTFGKDTGNGGLTNPPRPGKQVGMVQTVLIQRIDQRLQNVFLPDHFQK